MKKWLILLLLLIWTTVGEAGFIGAMGTKNPLTTIDLVEEFTGSIESGEVGSLNWVIIGGSATVVGFNPTATNQFALKRLATGTGLLVGALTLGTAATNRVMDPAGFSIADYQMALVQTDAQEVRIGWHNDSSLAPDPTGDGFYFIHDTAATSSETGCTAGSGTCPATDEWGCATRASGSATIDDTGVTVDTNFHLFTIDRRSGAVDFYIDGTLVCTLTATIPSANVTPAFQVESLNAIETKLLTLEYFRFRATVAR